VAVKLKVRCAKEIIMLPIGKRRMVTPAPTEQPSPTAARPMMGGIGPRPSPIAARPMAGGIGPRPSQDAMRRAFASQGERPYNTKPTGPVASPSQMISTLANKGIAPQRTPMMKKGGKVSSASKRADGIAKQGKTKGRII
jgi:hypothetical protein